MADIIDFNTMKGMVENYYANPDPVIDYINSQNLTWDQFWTATENGIPGIKTNGTSAYKVIYREVAEGTGNVDNVSEIAQALNSNTAKGEWFRPKSKVIDFPTKVNVDPETNVVTLSKMTTESGALTVIKTVASAVVAVGTGMALGKWVAKGLYAIHPDIWDAHNMSTLNPDTWHDITIDGGTVRDKVFNMLFTFSEDGVQAYAPEDAVSYAAAYLEVSNALDSRKIVYDKAELPGYEHIPAFGFSPKGSVYWYGSGPSLTPDLGAWCKNGSIVLFKISAEDTKYIAIVASENRPIEVEYPEGHQKFSSTPSSYTFDNKTVYYTGYTSFSEGYRNAIGNFNYITPEEYDYILPSLMNDRYGEVAWRMIYGGAVSGNIEGVTDAIGAKIAEIFNPDNLEGVKEQIKEQFPEMAEKKLDLQTILESGIQSALEYLPIPFPEILPNPEPSPSPDPDPAEKEEPQPTSSPESTQPDPIIPPIPEPNPDPDPEYHKGVTETITDPDPDPDPPPTGTGVTPEIVMPTGQASALWKVYNPTQSEVDSFGSWLWSSNFVEQIKKLFADPMQAIIGLHKVFATPTVSGSQTIKVGYLDSGVSASVVSSQYVTVDCGTVDIGEYYGNVFDYSPYTEIKLFLPFIGFVSLDPADVMRSSVSVTYRIDIFTGACLAEVNVKRDNSGGILYTFAGNCAVSYPVSSGNYASIMASLIGAVVSVGATAVGAAPVSVAGTALNRLAHTRTSVEHSGGFTGNSGAMGGKKPYIVITRPQTQVANAYETLQGRPSNKYVSIGSLKGFNRISRVHVEGVGATSDELDMIESILKSGIIV